MTSGTSHHGRRILVVDDNIAIHDDFKKVLAAPSNDASTALDGLEAAPFDAALVARGQREFELVSAFQGAEALEAVTAAVKQSRPFSVAFVDMRMPPGWDGLETIERLWRVDPHLQIVICSAHSDHSWHDLRGRLGDSDSLLILNKPFDAIEVVQCAHALTAKWGIERERRKYVRDLERVVQERTAQLELLDVRLADERGYRDRMETELRLAQRLEAIGQLAAGVAHEINTPLQYVSDNIFFIRESATTLVDTCGQLAAAATTDPTLRSNIEAIVEAADLEFIAERVPSALNEIDHGLERVSRIVRAMRELIHPGGRHAVGTDLNRAIQTTLDVTGSAFRMVADLELQLEELPSVLCFPSEINQVLLNLIVNAAHAMEGTSGDARGVLGIRTRCDGEYVVISVSDTGGGISNDHRDRIFDPFFTTKAVGKGTGQGLAISRSIVDRHAGTLTFESAVGRGTTFHVRLPIEGPTPQVVDAARAPSMQPV